MRKLQRNRSTDLICNLANLCNSKRRRLVSVGMMALALVGGGMVASCAFDQPLNVVLISLDTTRKDHLSLYGYSRETSPNIDRFSEGAVVFTNAVAQRTITNPSHASMFTGLYPHTHRVGESTRELGEEFWTLTEMLSEAGYRTGGFVSGYPLRSYITGLDQGFDTYDSDFNRRRAGDATVNRALEWLRGLDGSKPYFLFVHLYDAHGPYHPRPAYGELFNSADPGCALDFIPKYQDLRDSEGNLLRGLNKYVDRYDAMIRFQDDLVARLLREVDLDRTAVVITADHGETLGERATALNLNHGTSVFEEQIGIPLVLHAPGLESGRFQAPVETVDLLRIVEYSDGFRRVPLVAKRLGPVSGDGACIAGHGEPGS